MPHGAALSVESLARDSGASSINGNNVRYNREGASASSRGDTDSFALPMLFGG
jgi:hypothetical protein